MSVWHFVFTFIIIYLYILNTDKKAVYTHLLNYSQLSNVSEFSTRHFDYEGGGVYEIGPNFETQSYFRRMRRRTQPLEEVRNGRSVLLIGYLAGSLSQGGTGNIGYRLRFNDSEYARPTMTYERQTTTAKLRESVKALLEGLKKQAGGEGKGLLTTAATSLSLPNNTSLAQLVKEQGDRLLNGEYLNMVGLKGHIISGAIRYAVDEINNDHYWLQNYYLDFIFNNTQGHTKLSVASVMDQWDRGVAAFIGPEDSCQVEATIAAAQNLPMISFKCLDYELSDKNKYPTFARTIPTQTQIVESAIGLLKKYNWKKFTVVYGKDPSGKADKYQPLYEKIKALAVKSEMTILNVSTFDAPFTHLFKDHQKRITDIVEQTKDKTRIYVFFGSEKALQAFMYAMDSFNLLDKGEYMVIFLDPEFHYVNFSDAAFNYFYKPPGVLLETFFESPKMLKIIDLSKSLLAIIPSPIDITSLEYQKFWNKVIEFNHQPPFNFILGKNMGHTPMATPYASYLYDAVKLYARAVDKQLGLNGSPLDGKNVIKHIFGKKYPSIGGYDMFIDDNGDAVGNYTLIARQRVPTAEDELRYNLTHAMLPTGVFELANTGVNDEYPLLRFKSGLAIAWPSGKNEPPLDEPPCGFDGSKCIAAKSYTMQITGGVIGALVCIAFVIAFVVYRNWKYEQELAGLIWKIDLKDVHFRPYSGPSALTGSRMTLISNESGEMIALTEQAVPPINASNAATYKGSLVAVKEVRYAKKGHEISRATKIEMKKMRSLHHDNINLFMGIIVQPCSVYVVREFCAKGSLYDVLLNENIKLDSLFVASFVDDLLKGIIFLHDSELKVHGNLKSKNCVITSRWSLQVTDYGLHELRNGAEYANEEQRFEDLLWTAPELLRSGLYHTTKGTQKADVYAFGVILHEMITRPNGPWEIMRLDSRGNYYNEARDIIEKIMATRGAVSYRPNVESLECQDYIVKAMTRCWSEVPEQRPDMRNVRNSLKTMFKEIHKRNIMDHMMGMMEKYQGHLEDLVDDRTEQLREEKKRTETLLLRMLPQSVACQLMQGEEVEAETYEQVTIYFSDIVGFTSLSSESTPMEVIRLLSALYTLFDGIIRHYDVYKVETIGDAYMVVSGLPIRNGSKHAGEIATMALHLLEAIKAFKIPHRPTQPLLLRIGIHTGPCCAGVVGTAMPRYCLFGDTVNTASRMESNGHALRIHTSQSTKSILDELGGYIIEERGLIEMKGKGKQRTFWLLGKTDGIVVTPENERNPVPALPSLFPVQPIRAPNSSKGNLTSYASTQRLRRTPSKGVKEKTPMKNGKHFRTCTVAADTVGSLNKPGGLRAYPLIQRWCSTRPPSHNSSFRVNVSPLVTSANNSLVAQLPGGRTETQSRSISPTENSGHLLKPRLFRAKDAVKYLRCDGKIRKRSMSFPENMQCIIQLDGDHEAVDDRPPVTDAMCSTSDVSACAQAESSAARSLVRHLRNGGNFVQRSRDFAERYARRGSAGPLLEVVVSPRLTPRQLSVDAPTSLRPNTYSYTGPLLCLDSTSSLNRLSGSLARSDASINHFRRLPSITDNEHEACGSGINISVPQHHHTSLGSVNEPFSSRSTLGLDSTTDLLLQDVTISERPLVELGYGVGPRPDGLKPPRKRSSSCPDASAAINEFILNQDLHLNADYCNGVEDASWSAVASSSDLNTSPLPTSISAEETNHEPAASMSTALFNSENYLLLNRRNKYADRLSRSRKISIPEQQQTDYCGETQPLYHHRSGWSRSSSQPRSSAGDDIETPLLNDVNERCPKMNMTRKSGFAAINADQPEPQRFTNSEEDELAAFQLPDVVPSSGTGKSRLGSLWRLLKRPSDDHNAEHALSMDGTIKEAAMV